MDSISHIKKCRQYVNTQGRLFFSRKRAKKIRDELVNERGYTVIDRQLMRTIKSYSRKRFGSSSFWPWLALYTEIRGEFKPGWVPDDYYSVILLDKYNPESIRVSEYKTFDNKIFPDFIVNPLLIKIRSNYYDADRCQIALDEAQNLLYNYNKEAVIKEDLSLGGSRVKFVESREIDLNTYAHLPNYIIQPAVIQHETLMRLNAKAVSTLRIFTYLNNEGGIECKFALLRFGIGDLRVDNTSFGGGFCFIKSGGKLSEPAYKDGGRQIGNKHPTSGVLFDSIIVPNYRKAIKKCIRSHAQFPYARFIGWDVAINDLGEPVLLEWNSDPGFWKAEALKGPLFTKDFTKNDDQNYSRC